LEEGHNGHCSLDYT